MNKHVITIIIVAVVFAGGGFFGGMKYNQAKAANQTSNSSTQRQFGQNGGGRFARGINGANFVGGQILSKDNQSITLQLPNNNGSKIVFYSGSTNINKVASGTPDDLKTGENVVVSGTPNSDGSLTAQNITLGGGLFRGAPPAGPSTTQNQ